VACTKEFRIYFKNLTPPLRKQAHRQFLGSFPLAIAPAPLKIILFSQRRTRSPMKYRKFGKLDWDVSILGFGCMRLPTKDGRGYSEQVEEQESIALIRHAIDRGVNYFDTSKGDGSFYRPFSRGIFNK
jgi:hypothetical protein